MCWSTSCVQMTLSVDPPRHRRGNPGHCGGKSGSSRPPCPMRSPLVALCAAAALAALPAIPAAHAQTDWQTCSFNGRS